MIKKLLLFFYILITFAQIILPNQRTHAFAASLEKKLAPNFIAPEIKGEKINLKDYWEKQDKKAVLLSFFATWCLPCKEELPHLQELQKKYQDQGLQIVIISIDQGNKEKERVKSYIDGMGITLPVLLDKFQIIKGRYGIFALPANVLINKDGLIEVKYEGYNAGIARAIEDGIRKLLQ